MKKIIYILLVLLLINLAMLAYIKLSPKNYNNDENNMHSSEVIGNIEELSISFLNIGQGDAALIEFENNIQMLVDCGPDASVLEALGRHMEFYDKKIDYLIVTHPDSDHYGGCIDVLKRFDIGAVVYNGLEKQDDDFWSLFWEHVLAEKAEYIVVDKEMKWLIASTTLHFIYPDRPISGLKDNIKDNNSSIVFTIDHASTTMLFTGDAEEDLEEYLLSVYDEDLDIDILKVGHHGSGSSSGMDFVEAVSPIHSIISCGAGNSFGHPSKRVLKRLERASSTVWRTDTQGDIVFHITKNGIVAEY